jgi:predicted Zn-dependent peptidase
LPVAQPLFTTTDLGNGLRLHLRRTKAFKTVAARLVFHAHLDDDTAARALVPRVLGRGTERLPTLREMQIELDKLYGASLSGDARKLGDRHLVQIRSDWIAERLADEPVLDAMAGLWAEYLRSPARSPEGGLRPEIVEHERKMMADEAASVMDDKGRYARHRLVEEMCRGEPYARPAIGRLKEIKAVTAADVDRAYAWLLDRAPVDLFMVGDVSPSVAKRFAKRLGFLAGRRPARPRATKRKRPARVRTVREREDIAQAKLAMGFRTRVTPRAALRPALMVCNALFGGTPVSRLFKVVREQESLCYSIGSSVDVTKGLLVVHAGIEMAKYAKTRRLVVKLLKELQAGRVPEDSFQQARGMLLSGIHSMRDAPAAMIDFALEHSANGLTPDLDATIAALGRVTIAEVARAARSIELDTVYVLGGPAA